MIVEYPSAEAFAKLMGDEEYQKMGINFCRHVQNASYRVLRPTIVALPE